MGWLDGITDSAELGQESQASSCLRKGTPLASRVAQGVSAALLSSRDAGLLEPPECKKSRPKAQALVEEYPRGPGAMAGGAGDATGRGLRSGHSFLLHANMVKSPLLLHFFLFT